MKMTRGERKISAAAAAVLLACVLFGGFLYPYQQERTAEVQREVQLLRHKKEQLDSFAFSHADTSGDKSGSIREEKMFASLLPRSMNTGTFLTELQSQSRKSGVRLLKVVPGEEKAYESYKEQWVAVTAKGTYFEWLDFLYLLENDGRFLDIREMKGQSDSAGVYEGVIKVYIFSTK